jgi:hypothetical protein
MSHEVGAPIGWHIAGAISRASFPPKLQPAAAANPGQNLRRPASATSSGTHFQSSGQNDTGLLLWRKERPLVLVTTPHRLVRQQSL